MLKVLGILWPAFMTAGALEMLVFAFIDPTYVTPIGGVELSRTSLYSVAFLVFWGLVSGSAAISIWLSRAVTDAPLTA